jgi:hypothetical protein
MVFGSLQKHQGSLQKHQVVSPSAYHVLADNIDTKKNKQKDESSNIVVIETSFKWSNIWGLPC